MINDGFKGINEYIYKHKKSRTMGNTEQIVNISLP